MTKFIRAMLVLYLVGFTSQLPGTDRPCITPVVKHFVAPEYPGIAKVAMLSGNVSARVSILQSGVVGRVELLAGHPVLGERVQAALEKWRFEPLDEPAVTVITVKFRLVRQATDFYATRVSADLPTEVEISANVPPAVPVDGKAGAKGNGPK